MTKIAVLGLGAMGLPMATRLANDFDVLAYDVSDERRKLAEKAGLKVAADTPEAVEGADVALVAVRNAAQLEALLYGPGGIVAALPKGAVVILTSTVGIAAAESVAARLEKDGIGLVDAPVSGGEPGAIEGSLAFMVGGPEDVFNTYRPVLEVMGSSVTRVGDLGAGNTAKLANQAIVAVNIAVLGEALVLAKQAGVDPRGVVDAIRGGLAGSKVLEQKAEKMLADEFAPGFRINLHIKDLNNALETGHAVGASLPLTAAVREMMTAIANDGHLLHDHSSLLAFYERLAGTALAD